MGWKAANQSAPTQSRLNSCLPGKRVRGVSGRVAGVNGETGVGGRLWSARFGLSVPFASLSLSLCHLVWLPVAVFL